RAADAGRAPPKHRDLGDECRRQRLLVLPDAGTQRMVLKSTPDTRQMLDDRDSETPQLAFIADARLHQHLGRMHGTKRQDDLPSRSDAMERAVARKLNSRGASAAERESGHQGARKDREVRPIHVWEYVRSEHRLPSAVADAQIGSRGAAFRFDHATVRIL